MPLSEEDSMSKICQLFSGSTGNSTYIGCGAGGILVDAGVSCKRLVAALDDIGVDPKSLQGIFLTHEHTDHIQGVRVFASRYGIPVFGSQGTMCALEEQGLLTDGYDAYILDLPTLSVGDFEITSFPTSHDTPESLGYRVTLPDGNVVSVCTDLGFVSERVREGIIGSNAIVMESNHDVDMLKTGPYPFYLKERVLSRRGHLSNADCAAELPNLVKQGTTRFILAHLSRENNLPVLAQRTALAALKAQGMEENKDFLLQVAPVCSPATFTL